MDAAEISSLQGTTALSASLALPCGVSVPNRFAKAAMTEQMADPATNAPNDAIIRLYERWASSGAGILLTGNVMVDRVCMEHPGNVVVEDERDIALLARWADTAQSRGAHLWMQISHAGRQSPRKVTKQPVAPSAVPLLRASFKPLFAAPRALRSDEISRLIDAYAQTAAVAKKAGFKGVQIHAAHGYLISEFLSPLVNQRTDDWGGSPEKRMRYLIEVLRATRAAVGAQFPIGVKLNSSDFQRGGFSEDESMNVVRALETERIDLLEISGGNYENAAMVSQRESTRRREAYFLDYAEKVRGITKTPLMLTGGFRSVAAMNNALSSGAIDVVGLARPLCTDPEFCARVLSGQTSAATDVVPRSRVKLFDDMLQSYWHNHQMKRMGRGLNPNLGASKWLVLAKGMIDQALANPFAAGRSYPQTVSAAE
ncbi:MAG: NADH:flavin oxidoreductase/NADH oxidase family protein [Candidatus Hydrogenedentes bacterium]|nr:NADH:flavin oxidoreductase/NADH oxidase family protein [Candidatus Hydrogenedentota bacterium]